MRHPSGLDVSVRWLVLTLVGAGLLVLLPSGDASWLPPLPLLGLTPGQLAALGMITAAWAMGSYHLLRLPGRRLDDPVSIVLASVGLLSFLTLIGALVTSSGAMVIASLVTMIPAQLALGVRVDQVRRRLADATACSLGRRLRGVAKRA